MDIFGKNRSIHPSQHRDRRGYYSTLRAFRKMLKPIFTKARLIKRNLLLAAARSSGLLACGQARPGTSRERRPDLQQQLLLLLLLQQLQWWSSPQRHDKRVQLFALKIFTHDSVARAGAESRRVSRPMRFCVLAVMSAYVALALKSQPDSESQSQQAKSRCSLAASSEGSGPVCCCSIRCNIC